MLSNLFWVVLGSAFGGGLRYLLYYFFFNVSGGPGNQTLGKQAEYWSIVTVNLSGCLFIGVLAAIAAAQTTTRGPLEDNPVWLFWAVGLLGGYTTFSAFGLHFLEMIQQAKLMSAIFYGTISVAGGIACSFLGFQIGKVLFHL